MTSRLGSKPRRGPTIGLIPLVLMVVTTSCGVPVDQYNREQAKRDKVIEARGAAAEIRLQTPPPARSSAARDDVSARPASEPEENPTGKPAR
jgi:hypothetical protein